MIKPASIPSGSLAPEALRSEPLRSEPLCVDSTHLFGNRDEIQIAHGGEVYRLRRTRMGKLILTK